MSKPENIASKSGGNPAVSHGYDWNLIKSFLAILDAGTLSAASRNLGVSQPTLSRQVDELEANLQLVLFERGRKGAIPTAAALAIADHAREIEAASQALSLSATGKSQELRGTVRLTASQMVSTHLLPQILSKLAQAAPQIDIELVSTNAVESLTEREADIAVRMVRPVQPNLIAKKVNDIKLGAYVHEDYAKENGYPKTHHELKTHRLIGHDGDQSIIIGLAHANMKFSSEDFHFRCDDHNICYHALCAGIGVGFAPKYLARNQPQLMEIGKDFPIPTLPVWMVTHREIKTNRRIRMVYDFLANEFAAMDLG